MEDTARILTEAGALAESRTMSRADENFESKSFDTADQLVAAITPVPRMKTRTAAPKFIFRGQGDATWPLVPTALRRAQTGGKTAALSQIGSLPQAADNQIFAEFALLDAFFKACDRSIIALPGDGHAFRKIWMDDQRGQMQSAYRIPGMWPHPEHYAALAFAQHHGIPTRLLDWTWSGVVAAYFAAVSALKQEVAALAVWALNIEFLRSYKHIELVHMPGANSRRLGAQRGLFTLVRHDSDGGPSIEQANLADALVSQNEDRAKPKPLWKLSLPQAEASRLLYLCHLHGVDGASVCPDPAGAAAAVLESMIWGRPDPATGRSAVTVRPVSEQDIEGEPPC